MLSRSINHQGTQAINCFITITRTCTPDTHHCKHADVFAKKYMTQYVSNEYSFNDSNDIQWLSNDTQESSSPTVIKGHQISACSPWPNLCIWGKLHRKHLIQRCWPSRKHHCCNYASLVSFITSFCWPPSSIIILCLTARCSRSLSTIIILCLTAICCWSLPMRGGSRTIGRSVRDRSNPWWTMFFLFTAKNYESLIVFLTLIVTTIVLD